MKFSIKGPFNKALIVFYLGIWIGNLLFYSIPQEVVVAEGLALGLFLVICLVAMQVFPYETRIEAEHNENFELGYVCFLIVILWFALGKSMYILYG